MAVNAGLMSSKTTEWETPPEIYDPLHEEFNFELDPCASFLNHKCNLFFTADIIDDGLRQPWASRAKSVFMNPPYGREIGKWVAKASAEATKGALVVCLLPARTDTSWWHNYVMPYASEIRFLRGRVKFIREDGKTGPAPFPSAVVIFGKKEVS